MWQDGCWRADETLQVFARVRAACREAAEAIEDGARARTCNSAATIAAVERLARTDPRVAAAPDQWDDDP